MALAAAPVIVELPNPFVESKHQTQQMTEAGLWGRLKPTASDCAIRKRSSIRRALRLLAGFLFSCDTGP
jgi:hypothetical protein